MLKCEHHDYVEIACTFHYPLKMTLNNGEVIDCVAKGTAINENRVECIQVSVDERDVLIELDDVVKMEVTVDNPHFKSVSFK